MKFGLFGGAKSSGGDVTDSQSYGKFIDYVLAGDELGYASIFLVEHHFTGNSQVSSSLGPAPKPPPCPVAAASKPE